MRIDRRPIAPRDGTGQIEAVLDGPRHERHDRRFRCADFGQQASGDVVQRDEEVAADDGGGVVQGAVRVGDLERSEPKGIRQPPGAGHGLGALGADGAPGPVQLLRPAVAGQGLERVNAEAKLVRIQGGQAGRPAHVRDPRPNHEVRRHLADGRVRHAEDDELRIGVWLATIGDAQVALDETSPDRATRAAGADHVHGLEHVRRV